MQPHDRMHRDLVIESHGWTRWRELTPVWSALASACGHASFFLTPEAVGAWLDVFGPRLEPSIVVFRDAKHTVVGAAILVRRTVRKGPFAVRRIYLNTAGEDDADSACIEFNGLLCLPGYEARSLGVARVHRPRTVGRARRTRHARRRFAARTSRGIRRCAGGGADDGRPLRLARRCPAVGKDIVELLAARERTRIRQNVRKYSALGELVLDEPTTTAEALDYLAELANLHQKTWTSRGAPGSFASPLFCDYHRTLIERCFPLGQIQLLRLRAGAMTIGYHYAFLFGGRSYFYQCGYDYELGEKTAPGIIVHTFAIRHAAQTDLTEYDFLAGDVEYKRRFATGSREMHWMSWQAPSLKMLSFRLANDAKRALRTPLAVALAIRPQLARSLRPPRSAATHPKPSRSRVTPTRHPRSARGWSPPSVPRQATSRQLRVAACRRKACSPTRPSGSPPMS